MEAPEEAADAPAPAEVPAAPAGAIGATGAPAVAPPDASQDTSLAALVRMALGLHETPLPISPTHKFLFLQGVMYSGSGLLFMILPRQGCFLLTLGALSVDSFEVDASGHPTEMRMLQFTGFLVFLIGYLYMQGARENTLHFVAASALNRTVFVPLLMVLLAILGARLPLCILFALLDPGLTLLTWLSLRGQCPRALCCTEPEAATEEEEEEEEGATAAAAAVTAEPDLDPRLGFVLLLKRADPLRLLRCHSGSGGVESEMERISPTHRLIVLQGLLYIAVGLAAMIIPKFWISIFSLGSLKGSEMGDKEVLMMQMTGAAVVFIGHFFLQGARGNTLHFVATVTFNRIFIDPPAMLVLYLLGVHWQICLAEGLLDPLLALLTLASLQGKLPCVGPWLNRTDPTNDFTDGPAYRNAAAAAAAAAAAVAAAADGSEPKQEQEQRQPRSWRYYAFEMFVRRHQEGFRDDDDDATASTAAAVGVDGVGLLAHNP